MLLGAKFSVTAEGIRIIESDGSSLHVASEAGISKLSSEIQQLWHSVQQVRIMIMTSIQVCI